MATERLQSRFRLIADQPQIELVEFCTEQRVHVLNAEGRAVFRERSPPRPRRGNTCFTASDRSFLWLSHPADLQKLHKALDAPLSEPRLRAILAVERHFEDGFQTAEM